MTPREIIANDLCAAGVCSSDATSVPCKLSQAHADGILEDLDAAGYVPIEKEAVKTALDALQHIGQELGSYELEGRNPTKDELWGLFSFACKGIEGFTKSWVTAPKTPSLVNQI